MKGRLELTMDPEAIPWLGEHYAYELKADALNELAWKPRDPKIQVETV